MMSHTSRKMLACNFTSPQAVEAPLTLMNQGKSLHVCYHGYQMIGSHILWLVVFLKNITNNSLALRHAPHQFDWQLSHWDKQTNRRTVYVIKATRQEAVSLQQLRLGWSHLCPVLWNFRWWESFHQIWTEQFYTICILVFCCIILSFEL